MPAKAGIQACRESLPIGSFEPSKLTPTRRKDENSKNGIFDYGVRQFIGALA